MAAPPALAASFCAETPFLWEPFGEKIAPSFALSPHNAGHNLPVHQIPPPASTTAPCELPKEASGKHICAHPVWHKIIKGEKRCSLNIMPEFSIITISLCQNWKQCKISQEGPSIMHCRAVCRCFMKCILFKPVYTTLTLLKEIEGPVFSP